MNDPTPEKIDQLMVDLATLGIHIPAKDTAFFHAIVRRWLEEPLVSASAQGSGQ